MIEGGKSRPAISASASAFRKRSLTRRLVSIPGRAAVGSGGKASSQADFCAGRVESDPTPRMNSRAASINCGFRCGPTNRPSDRSKFSIPDLTIRAGVVKRKKTTTLPSWGRPPSRRLNVRSSINETVVPREAASDNRRLRKNSSANRNGAWRDAKPSESFESLSTLLPLRFFASARESPSLRPRSLWRRILQKSSREEKPLYSFLSASIPRLFFGLLRHSKLARSAAGARPRHPRVTPRSGEGHASDAPSSRPRSDVASPLRRA